jgi:hypothetical protein
MLKYTVTSFTIKVKWPDMAAGGSYGRIVRRAARGERVSKLSRCALVTPIPFQLSSILYSA